MNKPTFDAMVAQYAVKEASGEGAASWDGGVRCVLPEVTIYGKAVQNPLIGKNLFDVDAFFEFYSDCPINSETNRIQKVQEDGKTCLLMTGGSGYSSQSGTAIFPLSLKENTRYTLRFSAKYQTGTASRATGLRFWYSDGDVQSLYPLDAAAWGTLTMTSYARKTIVGIGIIYNDNGWMFVDVNSIQIEEGDVATSYEPYTGGIRVPEPSPQYPIMPTFSEGTEVVCCGENVYDFVSALGKDYKNTLNGLTCVIEDGYAVITGEHTNTGWTNILTGRVFAKQRTLPAGTYTTSNGLTLQVYANNTNVNYSGTFTIHEPCILHNCYIAYHGLQTVNDRVPLIAVRGTNAPTEYVPYFDGGSATAPELLAIPGTEYRDEWNPQTGKGVRRVGKLVLDGTESAWIADGMRVFSNQTGLRNIAVSAEVSSQKSPILCSHYHTIEHYKAVANIEMGAAFYNISLSFSFGTGTVYTADTWKAYLAAQYAAGTPVTVWYALAEPVPFETEPQPLIAPKGTGHIMQTGGTLDAVPITAKYVTHS